MRRMHGRGTRSPATMTGLPRRQTELANGGRDTTRRCCTGRTTSHLPDTVTPRTKAGRLDRLMALQQEISLSCNLARVGTEERVLVDAFSDGVLVCRSEFESPEVDGEILVRYDSAALGGIEPHSLVGSFLRVRIVAADAYDLTADPISIEDI